MEIVIEVSLNSAGKRGIDYYMANLVEWLGELDASNRYVIFSYFFHDHAARKARLPFTARPNFELLVPRWPQSLVSALEHRLGLPVIERCLLAGRSPTIYHSMGDRLPRLSRGKCVTTYYDLAAELAFERSPAFRPGAVPNEAVRRDALRSDLLIAVSEATKRDIVRFYGVPEERIEVVPTGVNPRFFHPVADPRRREDARRRYGLPKRFLLLLGPFEPRRNAEAVLRSFAALRRADACAGCKLVLVGAPSPYLDGLRALAAGLGLAEDLLCPGYVALEDMAAVFSQALALVHPTRFEGFGTVPLEAMACGTPVVTSDIAPVKEAVGSAALLVSPQDSEGLTAAIGEVMSSEALRDRLRSEGPTRAGLFLYEKIAARVLGAYERLGRER